MKYQNYAAQASDNSDSLIYISDTDTYELHYLNASTRKSFGFDKEEDWKGKMCYAVLQGKTEPCEFCTNHLLNDKSFYTWEFYNPVIDMHFSLKDKLIDVDGKKLRMEIATDITDLKQKINYEKALNACVETLHTADNPHESIDKLLEILATYYQASRGYIFSIKNDGITMANTHEWCKKGIEPQIDNLQSIPVDYAADWFEGFNTSGEFIIRSLEDDVEKGSHQYNTLAEQGITSLVTVPLRNKDGSFSGFIGLDDFKQIKLSTELLKSVTKFVEIFFDKTELINQLNMLSYRDALTNIPNRHSYNRALDHYDKNPPKTLGVMYININGLKHINESKGYKYGDSLIITLGNILTSLFGDNVFRIDGDEFIVLQANITKDQFDNLEQELRIDTTRKEDLTVSIGSLWNEEAKNIAEQIGQADSLMALEKSQYSGKYVNQHYQSLLTKNILKEIEMGLFQVYLQPQINLKTMKIASAEALARKFDENGKMQFPDTFIPFYEKENIIHYMDQYIFSEVCKLITKWDKDTKAIKIKIAVNLSRLTLQQAGIVKFFKQICKEHSINPNRIIIEITESIQLIDKEQLAAITSEFLAAGFELSLDDFGAGYSNLTLLVDTKFDEIKIDKGLVDSILDNERTQRMIKYSRDICTALDVTVSVAEGIETNEQCEIIKKMGFDKGQGYLFDRPLPVEAFEKKYMQEDSPN